MFARVCPVENVTSTKDDCFFCADGIHWDTHRIGWAVAGACAAVTTLITLFSMTMHATHYQQPEAQRQTMRVLMMPAVYSIVSFFSYRYYQEYEYYVLAETAYEAVTLSAFLMLLMELVSLRTSENDIGDILKQKDKRKLPFPFNCFRFRASKPYFIHTLAFSVLQYVVIRPLLTIVGIICQYYNVLCIGTYSPHLAAVYIDAIDFASISVALYGLIVFYVLCKDELRGRKPLNKFLAIKLIVFFTFYQGFVFSVLKHYNVIKATDYWTANNVADGLSALCTTVEMVIFSTYMGWAYSYKEYTSREMNPNQRPTNIKTYLSAIWDTINFSDFAVEIWTSLKFFVMYMLGKPGTHSSKFQKTFLPQPYTSDKYPMGGVPPNETGGQANGAFPNDTEGGPNSYQQMAGRNGWQPIANQPSPQDNSFNSPPPPAHQWGNSYSNASPTLQPQQPSSHPYGRVPNLPPPIPARPSPEYSDAPSFPSQNPTGSAPDRFPSPHPTGPPPLPQRQRQR